MALNPSNSSNLEQLALKGLISHTHQHYRRQWISRKPAKSRCSATASFACCAGFSDSRLFSCACVFAGRQFVWLACHAKHRRWPMSLSAGDRPSWRLHVFRRWKNIKQPTMTRARASSTRRDARLVGFLCICHLVFILLQTGIHFATDLRATTRAVWYENDDDVDRGTLISFPSPPTGVNNRHFRTTRIVFLRVNNNSGLMHQPICFIPTCCPLIIDHLLDTDKRLG